MGTKSGVCVQMPDKFKITLQTALVKKNAKNHVLSTEKGNIHELTIHKLKITYVRCKKSTFV